MQKNIGTKHFSKSMNPFGYWHETSSEVKAYFDSFYDLIDNSSVRTGVKSQLKGLFIEVSARENQDYNCSFGY